MPVKNFYLTIIGLLMSIMSYSQTSSDNFTFHYTNSDLLTQELIDAMEKKFDNLDKIFCETWNNVHLLDRSQKIDVYLYDVAEAYSSAPSDLHDWHVGYYFTSIDELHIKVPSTARQLKYFPSLENAAISILARYVVDKKRGSALVDGRSFGFGLYESGYTPDVNLINTYLSNNSNIFPSTYSSYSTWDQLDDETNVMLAYTYVFASLLRYGYVHATIWGGLFYGYESNSERILYQITRLFFLTDIEDGGMRKFIDKDDFVIYSNSQDQADLTLEALQWYANSYDEFYGERINHPLTAAIYSSDTTYRIAERGSVDDMSSIYGGGEARGHNLLRTSPATDNLLTERDTILTKYSDILGHEFMHNVFAYLAESDPPSWLNEGSAMFGSADYLQGYSGISVNNMQSYHDNYWNSNSEYFPDLDEMFDINTGFGYSMSTSAFTFLKNRFPKETLVQFMKNPTDFSIIEYNNLEELQRHLYETLYHKYIPDFLFNPTWNLETSFSSGTNFSFTWDGHYINDLVLEYSTDSMESWNPITEVTLASGSYSWTIPSAANCILRFSDKTFPEINFNYQILGDKPTFGNVFKMTFENGAVNDITWGNSGTGKDYASYVPRNDGNNYAKFNGLWNAITVEDYPSINFNENWTMQGDFLIENTTGVMNTKPVLLEKISTAYYSKNYSISFNNDGLNKLQFEYRLENNSSVYLQVDAGITNNNWYTFYFARSVEDNIVEARVYGQDGTLLGSDNKQLNGEEKVLTGAGDLYLGSGNFDSNATCLQGGLDNIVISDTYSEDLLINTFANVPYITNIPDQTIGEGESFTVISLDDYVSDSNNSDSELTWTYTGNTELTVTIDADRVASITITNESWTGSETITFKATDPDGYYGTNTVKFTALPYDLDLTSPNGGELVTVGSVCEINWENTAVSEIKIEYSINSGTDWSEIVTNVSGSSGSYNWTIPNEISDECLVKISDVSNSSIFDISASAFEIGEISNSTGGPYATDGNTVLLLHFDSNLNEESHNYTLSNHGTAKTFVSNPINDLGNAIYFDNSNSSNDSYVTVPNAAGEMSLEGNWTIEFWFYIESWDQSYNNWPVPILLPTTGFDANYCLELPSTYSCLKYTFTSNNGNIGMYSAQNSITTGRWYHVALINDYDNLTCKIMLHDLSFQKLVEQSVNYAAGTIISTDLADLRIGAGLFTENHFNGYIDELRISNVVRNFETVLRANFSSNTVSGANPLEVAFIDYSTQEEASINQWSWDFGDGTNSTLQNPEHTYSTDGVYTVTLTVTDQNGNSDTETKTGYITVGNLDNPIAAFTADITSGTNPLAVNFTDNSTQGATAITQWNWDFENDGTIDSNDKNPTWTYNEIGTYTVALTVSDGTNTNTETKTDYITVTNIGTDIDENFVDNELFTIYPNPSNMKVYISSPEVVNLSIFNIAGQKMIEKKNFINGEINISEFSNGIYMVIFSSDKGIVNKKLMKK